MKLTKDWLNNFIDITTKKWVGIDINQNKFGWQMQCGTGWLPGYSINKINEIEEAISWRLPQDVKCLMSTTSGLSKPQINIKPSSNELQQFEYRWRLNLEYMTKKETWYLNFNNKDVYSTIKKEEIVKNFDENNYFFLPVYSHRCIACDKNDLDSSIVLSIYGDDIVVYGINLKDYLEKEFMRV